MLSRFTTARLCHGCRSDLQVLFERGFCTTRPVLKSHLLRPQWRNRRINLPQPSRPYYATATRLQQDPNAESAPCNPTVADAEPSKNAYTRLEKLAGLERKLDELHRRLYDSVQEAVDEIQPPDVADVKQPINPRNVRDLLVVRAQHLVASLRNSGAPHEQIAREARQIFGETLPEDILSDNEYKIYTRLYGEPIPEEEFFDGEGEELLEPGTTTLLDQDGELVEYVGREDEVVDSEDVENDIEEIEEDNGTNNNIVLSSDGPLPPTLLVSNSQRLEVIAQTVNGQIVEEQELLEEVEDDEDASSRTHPFTTVGKFANDPGNVQLPMDRFVRPVESIMSGFSNKHLKEISEKTFGGPGLPDSALTPRSGRTREQVPIPLSAADHNMGEMEANSFIATLMPPTYAAITSVLVETRKRLGITWLNNLLAKEGGPRVLDAGSGGAGILAWREIVQAHWNALHTSDLTPPAPPRTKSVVLTGSHTLRHRSAELLENTTFIPRLPDYVHIRDAPTLEDDRPASQRKQFDIVIASHSLFGLSQEFERKEHVQNLWSMLSSDGGILIIIEKGIPRGFEAVAAARELLLEECIAVPEGMNTHYSNPTDGNNLASRKTAMIVAPCTNHEQCPMYLIPGKSQGRKDYCSFQQRYTRPNYLQRVIGATDRNHDDVDFSYISVMKGKDLRQKMVTSWQHIQDPLSSPAQSDVPGNSRDYKSLMESVHIGFDNVAPGTTLESPSGQGQGTQQVSTLPGPWNLPRLVLPALKRKQHVIMDVCTPQGKIERWTVPKSFGRQAYHDARKSQWGDLWALGAKTRILRNLRVGESDSKEEKKRRRRSRAKEKAEALREEEEDRRTDDLSQAWDFVPRAERQGRESQANASAKSQPSRPAPKPADDVQTFTFDHSAARAIDPTVQPQPAPVKPSPHTRFEKLTLRKTASSNIGERPSRRQISHAEAEDQLTAEEEAALAQWAEEFNSDILPRGMKTKDRTPRGKSNRFDGRRPKRESFLGRP
ncbi:uncharacterized protein A1O9_11292 [Exophiala aquamarina CBS 119918]|uniref:37S ribosomal protein S22 n=1 Tax=Exophiala aquamarina CBS 119918 TaxID=1182545 RepID=A0A072NYD7_9EURO|nr:uncharacterized protein A1O9_11292 [Exophiala aquamarina CBS 119918]KEF52874.1 hypothetical protein A1O9_11292 [Exophiala aquamarina CBS 119918]